MHDDELPSKKAVSICLLPSWLWECQLQTTLYFNCVQRSPGQGLVWASLTPCPAQCATYNTSSCYTNEWEQRKAPISTSVWVTMKAGSVGLATQLTWGLGADSCVERHLKVEVANGRDEETIQHSHWDGLKTGRNSFLYSTLWAALCKALEEWPSLSWWGHQTLCSHGYPEEKPITRLCVITFWELDCFTYVPKVSKKLIRALVVPSLKDWSCKHISGKALTQAWVEKNQR